MADPAAAARQLRLRQLHDACAAMQARSIAVLNHKDPESDWHRWLDELKAVVKTYGQDFVDALEFDANIPAVVVPAVLDDEPSPMTAPQARQLALRALIGNSLPSSQQEGSPGWLVRNCPHAGGLIGGQPQALAVLRTRYEVARQVTPPDQLLLQLLAPQWPRKLSPELYLLMSQSCTATHA